MLKELLVSLATVSSSIDIAVIGAGPIGCHMVAKLEKNPDYRIHLVARSNFQAIKESGISLSDSTKTTNFSLYSSVQELPPCDVIFIAVPISENHGLFKKDSSVFSARTQVVTLQNGIDFESVIADSLPDNTPLYSGTCWIKVTRNSPTSFQHHFGNSILLGRYKGIDSSRKCELFKIDDLTIQYIDCIPSVQLTKLALNIPFLMLMAKYGSSISEILADQMLNNERKAIQDEIIDTSTSLGFTIDLALISDMIVELNKIPLSPAPSKEGLSSTMKKLLNDQLQPLIQFMFARGKELKCFSDYNTKILLNNESM